MVSVRQQDHWDLIKFYFQLAVSLMTVLYSSILIQPKKKDDQISFKQNKRKEKTLTSKLILLNVKLFTVSSYFFWSYNLKKKEGEEKTNSHLSVHLSCSLSKLSQAQTRGTPCTGRQCFEG